MITKVQVWILLAFAAAVGSIVHSAMPQLGRAPSWLTSFGGAVAMTGLVLKLFDQYIWRWKVVPNWIVERPDLNGTWRFELKSLWVDPTTGERQPTKIVYLGVSQKYSHLSLRLYTNESESETVVSSLKRFEDGLFKVMALYRNEPDASHREDSPIHNGGLQLTVIGSPPHELKGSYWTDRGTTGQLRGVDRLDECFRFFEEAKVAFDTDDKVNRPS